jgi:hypothetical protein
MGTLAINCTTVVHDPVFCFEQCIHCLETLITPYGPLYSSDNDLGTSNSIHSSDQFHLDIFVDLLLLCLIHLPTNSNF